MNVLLVAATELEIEPFLSHFKIHNQGEINGNNLNVLITGVGMTATAFSMGNHLAKNPYHLAINAGIAGTFDRSIKQGDIVNVTLDCFAELGAEDGEDFLTIDELGFGKAGIRPEKVFEHSTILPLKKAKGITVNKVHGNDESIYSTVTRLNPQIESMEGAAFFYACNNFQLPCLQIRAISNNIERRNRESWNVSLAIKNLNSTLIELLNNL